ncbi:EF-hand calcium-binding domain-containing protein 1 [Plakobranchus ocellatus]|uniref:EF-hand calcium-binding domain-containing protein 1 n=1 Tax=Plakobranchus ocellatus TaxID=259542 RepID=A0AAV4D0S6_9GAST|nr:EF-hand calcium-binding domain-containing protein 1 [Plakobranchus ocellatus]
MLKNHRGDSDRPCRFTAREITSLLDIFMKFTQGGGHKHRLERVRFRDELHKSFQITDDFLMDRNCFQVYDLNSDGYISREEMFHLLKSTLVKQSTEEDPDEGVKDLVETALKKLDCDHDGRVSFPDFQQAVRQDTLMLECLGNCLPNQVAKKEFLEIIRGETNKY